MQGMGKAGLCGSAQYRLVITLAFILSTNTNLNTVSDSESDQLFLRGENKEPQSQSTARKRLVVIVLAVHLRSRNMSTFGTSINDGRPFICTPHLNRLEPHLWIPTLLTRLINQCPICVFLRCDLRDQLPFETQSRGEGGRIRSCCQG